MDKILAFGAAGMVGSRFTDLYHKESPFVTPKIDELDISNKKAVDLYFETHKKEFHSVINFAAFTDVVAAEKERGNEKGDAYRVNVFGPQFLAEAAKKCEKYFLQISTDFVFPGSNENPGPYDEEALLQEKPDGLTWYGWTKLLGERKVREVDPGAAILRISFPYRAHFKDKLDWVRNILILYDEGKLYPLFKDQQITPSFIDEVAKVIFLLIEEKESGIFHAASRDVTTPFEFGAYLFDKTKGVKGVVKPLDLDVFLKRVDNHARYPKFGGLKVKKTEERLGIKFMAWKEAIEEFARQFTS